MSLGECIAVAVVACQASSKVVDQVEVGTQCSLPLADKSVGCSFKAWNVLRSMQTMETVDQSSSTSDEESSTDEVQDGCELEASTGARAGPYSRISELRPGCTVLW
ncbi:uncharacterized protein LOC142576769 isoform X2 [Dermacentor variabilis]|uniref:uncharacterized protein LOC142576769 isoform X2 n=1 Tax=Dermacentor variabilis TaxID=34621 RepID=UPI003F5B98A8